MDEYDEHDEEPEEDGDGDHAPPRLDRDEAVLVRRDLDDLAAFRETFEPDGFKGVSVYCTDCLDEHYYEWDMLEHNLTALLESGETPVHEPAFDPHPDEYVDWEYAQGYVDGLSDGGAPVVGAAALEVGRCPFCTATLPAEGRDTTYCPVCGQHLAPARIAATLLARGWQEDEVGELLRTARVPPMRGGA